MSDDFRTKYRTAKLAKVFDCDEKEGTRVEAQLRTLSDSQFDDYVRHISQTLPHRRAGGPPPEPTKREAVRASIDEYLADVFRLDEVPDEG